MDANKKTSLEVLEEICNADNFEERVRTLRAEAIEHGDVEQVKICDAALLDPCSSNPAALDCAAAMHFWREL